MWWCYSVWKNFINISCQQHSVRWLALKSKNMMCVEALFCQIQSHMIWFTTGNYHTKSSNVIILSFVSKVSSWKILKTPKHIVLITHHVYNWRKKFIDMHPSFSNQKYCLNMYLRPCHSKHLGYTYLGSRGIPVRQDLCCKVTNK